MEQVSVAMLSRMRKSKLRSFGHGNVIVPHVANLLIVLGLAIVPPLPFVYADDATLRKCERARDDKRASCLQATTDEVLECQRKCPSDAKKTNCERQCQATEPLERAKCYAEEKATVCD